MSQDRDDNVMRHFASRTQQSKLTPAASAAGDGLTPVNVYLVFDQGFGGISDQVDATRFKYTGTSPGVTQYERISGRRVGHGCMQTSFKY